ncbi:MAG: hypothetical protein OXF74_05770 [Rhodobacteraceae bacterium]|nr:hypothetical protein [Paracoccaceae bacterium]
MGEEVRDYKLLLRDAVCRCPVGTKQKIARELGTSRSFISQIFNPANEVPLPARHLRTIIRLCEFTRQEESAFHDAYARAHPPKTPRDGAANRNKLCIPLPKFRNAEERRKVETAIMASADAIIKLTLGDRAAKG